MDQREAETLQYYLKEYGQQAEVFANQLELMDNGRMEALAAVRGRPSSRQAIGVVFGAASTVSGTFDVSEKDAVLADKLAHELLTKFGDSVKQEILLAAVARVGATVYQALEKKRGVTHD